MIGEAIYTIEEVADYLRVPIEVVEAEIAAGRLAVLRIAGLIRIRESQLYRYENDAEFFGMAAQERKAARIDSLQLTAAPDFNHTWPDAKQERFTEAREGVAPHAGRIYEIKLGFTTRRSAGRARRRCLVLVDRYPTVEFVASDAEPKKGPMASIIKDRFGKQLPARAAVPAEYKDLTVGPYRDVVEGPGASNGLAVICNSDDFETMVRHALIRCRYRGDREKKS
jgi:excisionase family DNA binding protein